jgi:hypothetical protein
MRAGGIVRAWRAILGGRRPLSFTVRGRVNRVTRRGIPLAVVLSSFMSLPDRAVGLCTSTPVDAAEATSVVGYAPALVRAREAHLVPSLVQWPPTDRLHDPDEFFYFEVRTTDSEAADGGLLGYYAVSKLTGQLYDDVLTKVVHGPELDAYLVKLRSQHCIGSRIVKRELRSFGE